MPDAKHPWDQSSWRDGICRPDLGDKAGRFWFLFVLFGGVVAGTAYIAPDMIHFAKVRWLILFPVSFFAVGVTFLIAALIATVRWVRFGKCRVRVHPMPGVIGGHFRGEVLLPEDFPMETDVRMELFCDTTTTTPGKGQDGVARTKIERHWSQTILVTTSAAYCHEGSSVIPFDYTVPYGLPDETASRQEGNRRIEIQWNLRVFARLQGPDLDITYRVPVFSTPESDPAVKGDLNQEQNLDAFLRDIGEQRRVRVEYVQGVTMYDCDARGMKQVASVVPAIFGLGLLFVSVLVPCNAVPVLIDVM